MQAVQKFVSEHRVLLGMVCLSILFKTIFLLQDPVVNQDAVVYITAAQKHSQGLFAEGIRHYRMPAYPLLLALGHMVFPNWIFAGQLLSAIPLVLSLIPLYFLTLKLFNKKSAIATTLLFTVLPVFNEATVEIIRDPLFLFLALSTLAFLAYADGKYSNRNLAGAVFMAVFATLIRIEGILLLALVPFLFFWKFKYKISLKHFSISLLALVMSGVILGSVLWGFSFLGISGKSRLPEAFSWVQNILTLDILANYHQLMERLEDFQQQLPGAHLRNNIIETTRHYAPIIYLVGLAEIVIKEIFPVSLIALWALRYRSDGLINAERAIIFLPLLAFLLLDLLFCLSRNFITTRYVWIPIVLTLPFVGYGISLLWERVGQRKLGIICICVFFFLAPTAKTLADISEDRTSIRKTAKWLKSHDPQQDISMLFNSRRLSLYTNRIYAPRYDNAFNQIKKNPKWRSKTDLMVLELSEKQLDQLPINGFKELARFKDKRTVVVILEREN